MSFQDEYKITNADRLDKGVYGLPDTPGMTTAAIQERFDSLGNLAIDKFNALVDAASDTVDDSDTKFPTNKAVTDYISGQGGAIINDTTPSLHKAYSSQKVENMFSNVASRVIDDETPSTVKTYSSAEIEEKLSDIPSPESIIDDDTASTDTTYSSSKLESDFISVSDTEEQTATDEFTTINGGLLSSCKVTLEPIQDLHGYDSPWVGGAGKNKLEDTFNTGTLLGVDITADNGVIDLNGTGTGDNSFAIKSRNTSGNYIYMPKGSYIFSAQGIGSGVVIGTTYNGAFSEIARNDSGESVAFSITDNTPSDYKLADGSILLAVYITVHATTYNHQKVYPMIRLSSVVDDSFAPYSNICPISGHTQVDVDVSDGQTTQEQVTVNLGGTYYSGTLDVVTGVFTPDTAKTTINDCISNRTTSYDNPVFYGTISGLKNGNPIMYSDKLRVIDGKTSASDFASNSENGDFTNNSYNTGASIQVFLRMDDYSDVPSLKSAIGDAEIVYELATPTPIQLSPTMVKALVGENHLSAPLDGQEITECKYRPIAKWNDVVQDSKASDDTTYSSNKINSIIPQIDDSATSATKVFSSLKTANLINELSERFDFSTSEKPIGWWTDGKVYYGKVINAMGCPKEMFGLMIDLGVEVDTFIGIFAVGNAQDDNYNDGYCMGGTIYCKVTKSEGQNTQIQPACAVMALGRVSLLVLYTKVED